MYGILTDDATLAREGVGDVIYYLADRVSGERRAPVAGAVNSIACWGDTRAVHDDPDRAAVAADGTLATPDVEGHHWGTVCPTDPDYRDALLDRIGEAGAVGDVRLTTLGFPGAEFCHCERCERRFAAWRERRNRGDRDEGDSGQGDSGQGDSGVEEPGAGRAPTGEVDDRAARDAWRSDTITEFVAEAADRVDGELVATLYPDPYPGHLRERAGLDPDALAPHVDGFLVPLCGTDYGTTYWVESLARGFASELDGLDATLTVQLSASEVDAERLVGLARRVEPRADAVVFGTHRANVDAVRETVRRLRTADAPTPR